MAVRTLKFRPGVVKDETPLTAQPYFTDSNLIRFVNGQVEKIGGWTPYTASLFNGICRGMFPWRDSSSTRRVAIGTHKRLYVEENGTLHDITPIRATTTDLANAFTTTSGFDIVELNDTSHGASAGDGIIVAQAAAVGGITPDGAYEVLAVVDANNLLFRHSAAATSTATGGGAGTDIQYQISIGRESAIEGLGYGVGGFGSGTYNTARTSELILPPRVWSLDRFNANLIACPRDGEIYEWTLATATPAAVVSNAPSTAIGIFVTEENYLVALAPDGDFMRVEWSGQDANTVWSPVATNTAGGRTLTGGNKLLQGVKIRGTNLLLTDSSIWTMTFIGGLDVFGFDRQGEGGDEGALSQRACVAVDGVAYWVGRNNFFMFDGVIRRMPRTEDINDFVFDNLEFDQSEKAFAKHMSEHNEIWFFYPVGDEISRYVKYNLSERCWDIGGLVRTDMIDKGIFPNPLMCGVDGTIYSHETGNDDDGSAMNEYARTSPIELSQGNKLMEINRMLPDFKNLSGTIEVDVITKENPQADETVNFNNGQPYTCDSDTEQIDINESGRQAQFQIGSSTAGTHWRNGEHKIDVQPLGER